MDQVRGVRSRDVGTFEFVCSLKGEVEHNLRVTALFVTLEELVRIGLVDQFTPVATLRIILSEKCAIGRQMNWPLLHFEYALDAISVWCLESSPSRVLTLDSKCGKLWEVACREISRLLESSEEV
ncbi:MAG: hypothetical protein KBC81_01430 [Candidatus Pacebacteria bacterium]|nr:hypothetical protein [Candidatus Paceibacterota bacterium]